MVHVCFRADTPYSGTSTTEVQSFNYNPTDEELDEILNEIVESNAESFEYLATGWDTGDMGEDELAEILENYRNDCEGSWERITAEEYKRIYEEELGG